VGTLAIDASTPAATTGAGPSLPSNSFSPPANSLIIVGFNGDSQGGVNPATPSITDSLGSHLTWTLVQFASHADTPAVNGQSALWWAQTSTAPGSMTVTVTNNAAAGTGGQVKPWVFTDSSGSAPTVGASNKGTLTGTNGIVATYTATATNSWGVGVAQDNTGAATFSALSGCTQDDGFVGSNGDSSSFLRRTVADGVNGNTTTLTWSLTITSSDITWAILEVVPVPGATTTVTAPDQVLPLDLVLELVAVQQKLPAATADTGVAWVRAPSHRVRLAARQPRAPVVLWQQLAPPFSRPRRRAPLLPRRAPRTGFIPPAQESPPPPGRARRPKPPVRKPPVSAAVPPPQVTVIPPLWTPTSSRVFHRLWRLSPRPSQQIIPPQVQVVAPLWVPMASKPHLRLLRPFKSRGVIPTPVQDQPPAVKRPRLVRLAAPVKRPRMVVPAQAVPPPVAVRRRPVMPVRVRRPAQVVPAQIVVIAPQYPPQMRPDRRVIRSLRRPARGPNGWMVPGVVVVLVVGQWSTDYARIHWLTQPGQTAWRTDPATTTWTTQPTPAHWSLTDSGIEWEA
jgi:hypothetical protein